MSSWFPHFTTQKKSASLVLRIGIEEIDFLLFQGEGANTQVVTCGSEHISHFTTSQTLEKIFYQLPQKQTILRLIATFPENQFNAQVVQQVLPPILPHHTIDRAEAFSIERDVLARANRIFEKNLFRESGILPIEFSLRRVKILERRIDGYSVPKLDGFKRGETDLSILGVFLLEQPFFSLEQFAKRHKIRDIRVVHIVEAVELFTRTHSRSGVYLHVEERKTQIAISNEGHFMFPGSISTGSADFTDFFGAELGMREPTAELFQERYFQGELSSAVQEKVHGSLLPEIRKFGTLVKEKLMGVKAVLPDSIWIFGKGSALRNIQSLFTDAEFEDLPFSRKPQVRFLLPKKVWVGKGFPNDSDPAYTTLCLLGAATEA